MSAQPARQVRARQAATPRARTSPSLKAAPRPKRRSRTPFLFWVASIVIVGSMVLGLAGTHVLLAQGAFEVDALSSEQQDLLRRNGELRKEYLEMSTSNRIAQEARGLGLVLPHAVEIVRSQSDPQAPRVPGGPE